MPRQAHDIRSAVEFVSKERKGATVPKAQNGFVCLPKFRTSDIFLTYYNSVTKVMVS